MTKKNIEINKDNENKSNANTLMKVTSRYATGVIFVIDQLADRSGRTRSDILRLVVDKRLLTDIPKILFVDHNDAMLFLKNLQDITIAMERIRFELNRIGVNYNQEIKLKHIAQKYANSGGDLNMVEARMEEEAEVKKECLPTSELDSIMKRYEDTSKEVGELLCKILG